VIARSTLSNNARSEEESGLIEAAHAMSVNAGSAGSGRHSGVRRERCDDGGAASPASDYSPPPMRRAPVAEPSARPQAPLDAGMTIARANGGVTGNRFAASPDVSMGSNVSMTSVVSEPIVRPPIGQSRNVSVFGLQTAAGARPHFARVHHHDTGVRHFPRASNEVSREIARPVNSALNDWSAEPVLKGDAAKELALRFGAMAV
jgi:hypothetical protein